MSHKFLSFLNNFEEFAFKLRAEQILDIFVQFWDPDIFCELTYQISILLKQRHLYVDYLFY